MQCWATSNECKFGVRALILSHIYWRPKCNRAFSEQEQERDKRKQQLEKPNSIQVKPCAINCSITLCTVQRVNGIPRLIQNISLHMMTKQLQAQMFNKSCELMCSIRNTVFPTNTVSMHFSNTTGSKSLGSLKMWNDAKIFALNFDAYSKPFVLFLRNESIGCDYVDRIQHWNEFDIRLLIVDGQISTGNRNQLHCTNASNKKKLGWMNVTLILFRFLHFISIQIFNHHWN